MIDWLPNEMLDAKSLILTDLPWFFNSACFLFEASLAVDFADVGGRGVRLLTAGLKYDVMRIWRGRIWPEREAENRPFCMRLRLEGLGLP